MLDKVVGGGEKGNGGGGDVDFDTLDKQVISIGDRVESLVQVNWGVVDVGFREMWMIGGGGSLDNQGVVVVDGDGGWSGGVVVTDVVASTSNISAVGVVVEGESCVESKRVGELNESCEVVWRVAAVLGCSCGL